MFWLTAANRYFLCVGSVDMRKGFDTLSGVVRSSMGMNPLSGDVFIFINGGRDTIKLLHWERGGMVVYHKRLERGRFVLPKYNEQTQSYHIEWRDLVLMIEGIKWKTTKQKSRFEGVKKD